MPISLSKLPPLDKTQNPQQQKINRKSQPSNPPTLQSPTPQSPTPPSSINLLKPQLSAYKPSHPSNNITINRQSSYSIMMRRSIYAAGGDQNSQIRTHKKSKSNSTVDSGEGSAECKPNKQKSQLCKKYMDNGYCPYEKRCKFAHGLNQLRKNNEYNSKYKTKECGSFKNHHFCVYGDRCNFIHVTANSEKPADLAICEERDGNDGDLEMKLIRKAVQEESRLLKLLN